jgi:hypothetical protein
MDGVDEHIKMSGHRFAVGQKYFVCDSRQKVLATTLRKFTASLRVSDIATTSSNNSVEVYQSAAATLHSRCHFVILSDMNHFKHRGEDFCGIISDPASRRVWWMCIRDVADSIGANVDLLPGLELGSPTACAR